jgi:hypothetical protein
MAKQKTFTLDQAQTLLPVLKSLIGGAMEGKKQIEQIEKEFQKIKYRVMLTGGMLLDVTAMARRKAEQEKALQEIKDALAEITSIGVQVKYLDMGLLDFPCVVDNEIVLLCWKYGEDKIEYWHGTEEGFAGRKPIDERITGKKKEKPN